jgi:hypothetical protein
LYFPKYLLLKDTLCPDYDMGKLELNQILTLNKEGNKEYISTGATLNNMEYISLPTILGMYATTDPTIRKYLKKNGQKEVDYFLSDGKLFISSKFLSKNHFYPKKENITTFHPYRRTRIRGCVIPYNIIDDDSKNCTTIRGKITKELTKINWDYFIHINTTKYVSSDDWDVIMDKFINLLSDQVGSKFVCAAYSKEKSVEVTNPKSKYEFSHCHAHILIHRDSKFIKLDTIKELFLQSMNKSSFKRKEYQLRMYDKLLDGIGYMLKKYEEKESNFSMIYPEL